MGEEKYVKNFLWKFVLHIDKISNLRVSWKVPENTRWYDNGPNIRENKYKY